MSDGMDHEAVKRELSELLESTTLTEFPRQRIIELCTLLGETEISVETGGGFSKMALGEAMNMALTCGITYDSQPGMPLWAMRGPWTTILRPDNSRPVFERIAQLVAPRYQKSRK